jgi:hypothetical protein
MDLDLQYLYTELNWETQRIQSWDSNSFYRLQKGILSNESLKKLTDSIEQRIYISFNTSFKIFMSKKFYKVLEGNYIDNLP